MLIIYVLILRFEIIFRTTLDLIRSVQKRFYIFILCVILQFYELLTFYQRINKDDYYHYISNATARIVPDLLKALTILLDTTVRRSAVDQKDLKPN